MTEDELAAIEARHHNAHRGEEPGLCDHQRLVAEVRRLQAGNLVVRAVLQGVITPEQWGQVLFNPTCGFVDTGQGVLVVEARLLQPEASE